MGITKETIVAETDLAFEFFEKIKDMDYNARHRVFNLMNNLVDQKQMEEHKAKYGDECGNVKTGVALRPY